MYGGYYERLKDKTKCELEELKNFKGSKKEYLITLWHLRNHARLIVEKINDDELLSMVYETMSDETKFLMDVFDDIYWRGVVNGSC